WVVDLHVEHNGYDALDIIGQSETMVHDEGNESSDAYCSSDDEELGFMDFHTEGDGEEVTELAYEIKPQDSLVASISHHMDVRLVLPMLELEHNGYDALDIIGQSETMVHDEGNESSDAYCSSDDEELGFMDFHTEGDDATLDLVHLDDSEQPSTDLPVVCGELVVVCGDLVFSCGDLLVPSPFFASLLVRTELPLTINFLLPLFFTILRLDDEETSSGDNHFKRIYVCFKGVKDSWLAGCRKVIGLDGCFLKQTCIGELLVAMGRDTNNQMYLIAWVVVKVENNENWCWFLALLHDDLNLRLQNGLTVISDSHKMEEMKVVSQEAYEYLIQRNPNSWCRTFFRLESKCPNFENGICESFNRAILVQRTKSIITMLKDISKH
nr:hypothetical protein [Tanacetum cinerariifolium]